MTRMLRTLVTTAAGLALVATARGADGPRAIRVGYTPDATHATAVVGFSPQRKTYYKAFPDTRFDNALYWTGRKALEELRAGRLDIAFVNTASAISAWESKPDFYVLAAVTRGGYALYGRKERAVTYIGDLQYRTAGVPEAGATADVLLRYQMALNGVRPKERKGNVTIQVVEAAQALASLKGGALDAACLPEPWGAQLETDAGARMMLGPKDLFNNGAYPSTLLVARKDWADRYPALANRFAEITDGITRDVVRQDGWLVPLITNEIVRLTGRKHRVSEEAVRLGVSRCRFSTTISQRELQVFANLLNVSGYRENSARLNGILFRQPTP